MAADSGKHFGKYRLVDVVGQGAMGVVHRAFDPVLNRTLAIKVMGAVLASDAQLRERFLREARAAGSLQHPNVITIFDFGEINDHLYIAMEYVEGYDLAEMMTKQVPLAVEAKLDILIDTLNGLGYAHSHGVVHRDIKPANIRVTVDGRAKLMDFGIAHIQASELTRSGEMIGTPQYMAPEQVSGDPVTPATDLFSLSTVAYELFTGVKPFDGESLHAVLFAIMSTEPRPVHAIVPGLPITLSEIIAKGMAKAPGARFENAAAMAKAFIAVRQALAPRVDTTTAVLREAAMAAGTSGTPIPATLPRGAGVAATVRMQSRPVPAEEEDADSTLGARGRSAWNRPAIWGVAAVLIVTAWVAIWQFAGGERADGGRADGARSTAAGPPAAATVPLPADSPPSPPPTSKRATDAARPTGMPVVTPAATPAATSAAAAARGVSTDTLVTTVRTNAILARRRAMAAGATSAEVSDGDLELQAADRALSQSRAAEAITHLANALERWTSAARIAEQRAAAAGGQVALTSTALPAATPPLPAEKSAPPPAVTPAAAAAPVVTDSPAAARPPSAAESRAAIEQVIRSYARAIESADIAQIRRVYPGLTREQQANWEEFYRAARNVRATLVVERLDLTGATATASLAGTYEYDNRTTGRAASHQLQHVMTFTRDATGGWHLSTLH